MQARPELFIRDIEHIQEPSLAFEGLLDEPMPFFLDSALEMERYGRYSIMGSRPRIVVRSKNGITEVVASGRITRKKTDPFQVVAEVLTAFGMLDNDEFSWLPFTGGAVGYLGYDLNRQIEIMPDIAVDDLKVPDLYLGFYTEAIVIDHKDKRTYAVAYNQNSNKASELEARHRLNKLIAKIRPAVNSPARQVLHSGKVAANLKSNFTLGRYRQMIEKARQYINEGEIFQVNLAQRFSVDLSIDHYGLYKRLRLANPAPFGAFLGYGGFSVLSSSPERFMFMNDRYVETRPIKGTRPRFDNPVKDKLSIEELTKSEKDAAEHVMIVDVERNDLGRVCEHGSVSVPELMVVESYEAVHHLVSTVIGRLKPEVGPMDLFRASFPGGSISGAPKIRAMEIIEELEPHRRNIYTGAIGYISTNKVLDTSIVIRTITALGNRAYLQVGGGIVADSDADAEYAETLDKARALFSTLGLREDEL